MIGSNDLDNPERDLSLEHREEPKDKPRRSYRRTAAAAELAALLAALREEHDALNGRIRAARKLKPERNGMHCLDCWQRGRDGPLRAVEGK